MGSRQLFCLRWSNHQTNMLSVFDELLQNEALVDVTIACEGLSIKAHKVVLSACSPYFQNLFVQNPCKHPIVILKDIKYSELKALVDFMYKGEVNVTQEQLNALLKTAESLKIKGLAEVTGGLNGQNERSDAGTPPPPPPLPPPPIAALQQQQQLRGHLRRNLPPVSSCGDVALGPVHPVAPAPRPTAEAYPQSAATSVAVTPCSGAAVAPTVSCLKMDLSPPPPLKRRKVRHRRKSAEKGGGDSDGESGDVATVRGSPEVIEAKVEMAEEGFDSGPGRPPDADQDAEAGGRLDRPSDAASESVHDTSSQCSFRSQELGPPSVRSDDLAVAPSSTRLKPTFTFEPPIGVAVGGASTSGEGSSQGFAEPKDAPIMCWECGIKFRHRASLSRHQRTLHRERHVRYPCKVCGRTFKRSDNMKFHVQLKHHHHHHHQGAMAQVMAPSNVAWTEDDDYEDDDVTIISESVTEARR